jgi:tripartite-type tricarboxylate transporter receptor subunit TctC
MRDILAREGSEPATGTPEQLRAHINDEVARLAPIVKASRAGR